MISSIAFPDVAAALGKTFPRVLMCLKWSTVRRRRGCEGGKGILQVSPETRPRLHIRANCIRCVGTHQFANHNASKDNTFIELAGSGSIMLFLFPPVLFLA